MHTAKALKQRLLIAALASVLIAPGCSRAQLGAVDDVTIVRYRYMVDEVDKVVRVVGEVQNAGDLPTPEADVVGTVRSRTGSQKGQNRVSVPQLEPNARHQFTLAITGHGSIHTVSLYVVEPGTLPDEEISGEETSEEG